jgi:hypothetical protein
VPHSQPSTGLPRVGAAVLPVSERIGPIVLHFRFRLRTTYLLLVPRHPWRCSQFSQLPVPSSICPSTKACGLNVTLLLAGALCCVGRIRTSAKLSQIREGQSQPAANTRRYPALPLANEYRNIPLANPNSSSKVLAAATDAFARKESEVVRTSYSAGHKLQSIVLSMTVWPYLSCRLLVAN